MFESTKEEEQIVNNYFTLSKSLFEDTKRNNYTSTIAKDGLNCDP